VYGGPQVPNKDPKFLEEHAYIDLAVEGEGELVFKDILEAYLKDGDYREIPGVSCRDTLTDRLVVNEKGPRMRELDKLPSPYIEGAFESLMAAENVKEWMGIWETNRGCPFSCTFCDWGSLINSKVTEFNWDRLMAEINWFSKKKIRFVFGADANFGIRKRDIDIAQALVDAKAKNGYPQDFRVCFTKNSTQRIYDVAKLLHDGELLRGVSISMQSLNDETLEVIKRKNIKLDTFRELQEHYNKNGVSTFTELILGLPGETYESFVQGIDTLLNRGQHSQIIVYNCTVMPNAEIGDPEYRKKHEIKTVDMPIFTAHASAPDMDDPLIETEPVIVSTRTMNSADYRQTHYFSWIIQAFHTLGPLKYVAIFLKSAYGVRYSDFYEALIHFGKSHPDSLIGSELALLDGVLDNALAGKGFNLVLPKFSDITWPVEEATLCRVSVVLDDLYKELFEFTVNFLESKDVDYAAAHLRDLFLYQQKAVVNAFDSGDEEFRFSADIPDFVQRSCNGDTPELDLNSVVYKVSRGEGFKGDIREYAKRIVWYGRKGGKYLYKITREESVPTASYRQLHMSGAPQRRASTGTRRPSLHDGRSQEG